ncbi:MAG: TonB-dependent receptor [Gammaproteobacteria bacterium RIFCSPLOWO2_02_FULL_57_10]|nr:MAG: TonB-dependent receptor [Gammaproteobacteria bacterium RIFCSPLOWO2_02_FULL_57_10]
MSHRTSNPRFALKPLVLALAGTGLLASQPLFAQGESDDSERDMPAIYVIGKEENAALRQPGAVSIVGLEEMELRQPRSTEEILRTVPGVTVKPEEESAIVGNIGMRGLSSADYKTLILEDGVPVAPGLFVGNGRYYNPRVQRMEGIEVLKGAASLRYGPSTIGGVINYITRQPADGVELSVRGGSFGSREATLEVGGSSPSGEGVFGLLATREKSDGFMDKGYDMTDIVVKTGLQIGNNQSLSLKYSDYESDANISYRGVFLNEYRSESRDNPAPDDWFLSGRRALDLNHEWEISDTMRLNTLAYVSETWRDYWRYGTNNAASAAAGTWIYTNSLNGNNRAFERTGVDSRLQLEHSLFGIASEAELGVRYMTEVMDDVTVAATRATPRTGNLSKDVRDSADSIALYGQNRFQLTETVALTAGLRIEKYEQDRKDRRRNDAQGATANSSNTEYLPGLGLTWQAAPDLQLFASVYKAFSPALNGDALDGLSDQKLDAERSVNMEVGLRGNSGRLSYEMAAFRMDFDNQIVPANSNSVFQNTNGGATIHQGMEVGAGFELGGGFSVSGNTTWIPDAEFNGNRYNANGTLNTPDGNRITYTPEWTANLSLDYSVGGLRSSLALHHTGEQFTDTANSVTLAENTSGFFTGRIDSYTLLDLNLVYEVNSQLSFSGSIKNLTDRRYIASLRQGIYVGVERSVDAGFVYRF